jgi:hypothetical protein
VVPETGTASGWEIAMAKVREMMRATQVSAREMVREMDWVREMDSGSGVEREMMRATQESAREMVMGSGLVMARVKARAMDWEKAKGLEKAKATVTERASVSGKDSAEAPVEETCIHLRTAHMCKLTFHSQMTRSDKNR